jgi:hypothetical protein
MGRSTFEGPVLSGDNRFGPTRNVGYVETIQSVALNLATTTANTAGYSGASAVYVNSNNIPNQNAVIYTPSSTVTATAATGVSDTATLVARGAVFYLPAGCRLVDMFVDVGAVATVTGGTATLTSQTVYISNTYNNALSAATATYAVTGALSAVGRQSLTAFSATQLTNQQATSTDVIGLTGVPNLSQVVFNIALVGVNLDSRTALAGQYYFTVRYTQPDGNIGSTTAYPYGNFD